MPSFRPEDLGTEVWMGVAGAMLTLLRSIVDGTRRSGVQLVVGCIFGGIGAGAAGLVWADSGYVYVICGVAAIITENVVVGLFNASKDFRDHPKDFFSWAWKLIVPTIPFIRSGAAGAVPAETPASPAAPSPATPLPDDGSANG